MIREAIEKLVGSSSQQPLYSGQTPNGPAPNYSHNYAPQHYGNYGGSYGCKQTGPTPAQSMIEEGRHRDRKYGYMYGDYYEKKARKKADKVYGSGHLGPNYGGHGGYHPAQAMIGEGRYKDRKIRYMYGDYYEKRARKKAQKMYSGY